MIPVDLIRSVHDALATRFGIPDTPSALAMSIAIGLQESGFKTREQFGHGPAHSYWQDERGGAVRGVLHHHATKDIAIKLAGEQGIPADEMSIWKAFASERGDWLAAAWARLLLWTDPHPLPLPVAEAEEAAWNYYLRNWRPGKPHREAWSKNWADALEALDL